MAPTHLTAGLTGGPRHVISTVVAAALIAAIAFGGWWAWGRQLPLAQPTGAAPTGEAGRNPSDPLAVAAIGGAEENYARVRSLRGVAVLNMLTRDELAVYQRFGTGRVRLSVRRFDDGKAMVLLAKLPGEAAARKATDALLMLQHQYGFTPSSAAPAGIDAGVLDPRLGVQPGGRAHYVHGDIVVRVEFRGTPAAAAQERFFTVLAAQAEAVSPDG